MADEITNIVLLQHMHAMKNSLELQIAALDRKVEGMNVSMHRGFEEARQHRQALQEDLEATMRMVSRHEKKLARR